MEHFRNHNSILENNPTQNKNKKNFSENTTFQKTYNVLENTTFHRAQNFKNTQPHLRFISYNQYLRACSMISQGFSKNSILERQI